MNSILRFTAVLLVTTLAVAHPAGSALPEARASLHSAPTAVPVPHRSTVGKVSAQSIGKATTNPNRQIPFQFCPEFFGEEPKPCSQCGGDTQVAGQCDRVLVSGEQFNCQPNGEGCTGYYCKCINDAPPYKGPEVTMTTVINGETGTVVWEPMTLSQYTNLRAKTTVTLTELATASDSSDALETVVAAVFAGGVAWWVGSQSGAIGAALAIPPPEAAPEGSKEDDKICKSNPKEECKDCGGADAVGLCKSGNEAGCPCDVVQHCPNQPPACSDPQCGGDNGKSQCKAEGEINGCLCCPDEAAECGDSQCNGDSNGMCQADSQKGCRCEWFFNGADALPDPPNLPIPNSQSWSSAAANVFTKIWSANTASVPGYVTSPASQSCTITTQTRQASNTLWYGPPTQTYCLCDKTVQAALAFFTSGTRTTSICANGQKPPAGWTQIPADGSGHIITSSSALPAPAPTTTKPLLTTKKPVTTTKVTTTTACRYGWCGAPLCAPACGPN